MLSLLLLILKRWHYTIHFKGETADAAPSNDKGPETFEGNALPGNLLQRTLIRLGQSTR